MGYLTIKQTAERLNLSINTVRSLLPKLGAMDVLQGRGKNRCIRIPETALEAYLSGCRIVEPVPAARAAKPFKLERRRA